MAVQARGTQLVTRTAATIVALACATVLHAEHPPLRFFSTADGLAANRVRSLMRDSRGIVWIGTSSGLSRFDGHRFVSYRAADGLGHRTINDMAEAPDGTYWIATNGDGVVRFDPSGRHLARWPPPPTDPAAPRFTPFRLGESAASNRANAVHIDRYGRLWVGTDDGLFRRSPDGVFTEVDLPGPPVARGVPVWAFAEDADGTLWIGTSLGLVHRQPNGVQQMLPVSQEAGEDRVLALVLAPDGRLWIGHAAGLFTLVARGQPFRIAPVTDVPAVMGVRSLYQQPVGPLWLGTVSGALLAYDGRRWVEYASGEGLPQAPISALAADAAGNLWIGYTTTGVIRLLKHGFRSYGRGDGLEGAQVSAMLLNRAGQPCVVAGRVESWLQCYDGSRFIATRPRLRGASRVWPGHRAVLQDRSGHWWFGTSAGLYRLPRVSRLGDLGRADPVPIRTNPHEPHAETIRGLFEDSQGNVWIRTRSRNAYGLSRWNHADGTVERIDVPVSRDISDLAEDRQGNLWMGFRDGGVARLRSGRFEAFDDRSGMTLDWVAVLHVDRAGRLWIGTNGSGLFRVDDPGADAPRFTPFVLAHGGSTPRVSCMAEDSHGELYVCSDETVHRLDPSGRMIARYGPEDGLPEVAATAALADPSGSLWIGTTTGVSRIVPQGEAPEPPTVLMHRLEFGGSPYPLSALGQASVPEVTLSAGFTPIRIGYASDREDVTYQYRLVGAEPDWTAPVREREVTFASLSPGRYRFEARAVAPDGTVSTRPAVVEFAIPPPLWQRWWAIGALAAALAAAAYAAHRVRVAQLVAVERIRTRIATDLHDDIGSGLSRIAILSEVAMHRAEGLAPEGRAALAGMAAAARDLIDGMSDIVWAINPRHDALEDLTGRMRRFASDVLASQNIEVDFEGPGGDRQLRLSAGIRRDLFLIFKETVNNIARHADCTSVRIALRMEGRLLDLTVADNGRGFDPAAASGQGLRNLRARAAALGGQFDVSTRPGAGTIVSLQVSLQEPTSSGGDAGRRAGV